MQFRLTFLIIGILLTALGSSMVIATGALFLLTFVGGAPAQRAAAPCVVANRRKAG